MTTFVTNTAFEPLDNGFAQLDGIIRERLSPEEVRIHTGAFGQVQKRERALLTRVISGRFEFIVCGDTQILIAGESVAFPANVASG